MHFEDILDFLFDFDIFGILKFIVLLILGIISFRRTGKVSQNLKGEIEDMKNRLPNYRETAKPVSQNFDTVVPQYRLNRSSNELEELPDKLDLQEHINSSRDTSLIEILKSLEPVETERDRILSVRNELQDNLDFAREADEWRLDMCEKYNLDPYSTYDDVIKYLNTQSSVVKGQLDVLNNSIKGVQDGLSQETQTFSDSATSEQKK